MDIIKTIVGSKTRLAVAISMTAMVTGGGATFGSWAVSADAGSGYAKALTAQNLTLSDASASTVADLYPGGSGAVKIKVTNPNAFAVTVTGVSGAGSITSDKGAGCDASTGVTFTNQTGLTQSVGAGATVTFTLSGAAAMSTASVTSCQGGVFTIPVTLTATS
jgi:hypothetical protein